MMKVLDLVEDHAAELVEVDASLAFSVKRDILVSYLSRLLPVLPQKETIPGSELVHLTAHEATKSSVSYVSFYATNGEQQVLFEVDSLKVFLPGSTSVPGRKLLEVAKLSPKKSVHIQVVGTTMFVRSGNVRWRIQTDSNYQGPKFIRSDFTHPIEIPRREFLEALKIVLKASPPVSARESLQQVQIKDGVATVCDGTRIHRKKINEFPAKTDFNLQINAAKLLVRALAKTEESSIFVELSKTAILFDVGAEKFITQRSILPFPKIDNLFLAPAIRNEHTLSFDRQDLIDSIFRVKVTSDPVSAMVSLSITQVDYDKYVIKVHARDPWGNTSEDTVDCHWFGPEKFDPLHVHYRKFIDLLESTTDEFVFLKLGDHPAKGQRSPIYLNSNDEGLTVVLQQKQSIYM